MIRTDGIKQFIVDVDVLCIKRDGKLMKTGFPSDSYLYLRAKQIPRRKQLVTNSRKSKSGMKPATMSGTLRRMVLQMVLLRQLIRLEVLGWKTRVWWLSEMEGILVLTKVKRAV